jgi:phenylacetate-CoA ligase
MDLGDRARAALYLASNVGSRAYLGARAEALVADRVAAVRRARSRRNLARYLRYCLLYSPLWKERWPHGFERFDDRDADDVLAALPPLTKEDLRRHGDALRIRPEQRRPGDGFPPTPGQVANHSGGSTGVPTEVWQDAGYAARNRAVIDEVYAHAGVVAGRPTFYLWGSNNELTDLTASWKKKLSTRLRGLIPMPAFALSPAKVREYAAQIAADAGVDQAICFVSALDTFTAIAEQEGIPLRRVRTAITGGGKLQPQVRERVRRLWADDVFEMYGGRDVGVLAVEARDHDGYYLFPWHNRLEVLREGRRVVDGGEGEIHVTCVQNYSCALIRLGLGDVGVWSARDGGRLHSIVGRSAEHLHGKGGVRVDPSAVIHLIGVVESRPWMRRFQLVQTAVDAATLRLETWTPPDADELEQLRRRIADGLGRALGAPLELVLAVVAEIEPLPSGKHQYVVGWRPPPP